MRCKWWKDHVRQVHMDFHMPEFPRDAIVHFDAQAFVDHLERGRINMVALFSKCHFGNAFYDTRVGHKHAGLDADFLMETSAECRRRGIRTLAYYSLCTDKRAWDENPAWRIRKADGEPLSWEGTFWGMVCMNSPYKDELVMPQLAEIAAEYPVDGFWLDIPMPGGHLCYCEYCRRKWLNELDLDIAEGVSPRVAARLVQRTVADYHRQVRRIIDRHNPELVVATNQVGSWQMARAVKDLCEIGVWESQPKPGNYLGHSLAARLARNDVMDIQVMSVRFYQGWGDLTLKPAAQMTTEFAAMIGNGMPAVSGDQVNVDGTLQPPVYEMFNESFGFVEEREAALRDAESVRHTVVLLPVPDETVPFSIAQSAPRVGEDAPWAGAHKMLVESHVQVDLAYSSMVDDFGRFPLIVLPEPGAYTPEEYDRLREYVRGGGVLVAAGHALLAGGEFQLADVFGLEFHGAASFKNVHFVPDDRVRGSADAIPLQVRGQAYKVAPAGAEELAAMHFPMTDQQGLARKEFRSPHSPAAAERSPYPFATLHAFGEGKAVYLAGSVFSIYWRTNHHWLRQFVEALLRYVDPAQPVALNAAPNVEVNLMTRGDDLLVNLIHYSLGHQGGQSAISAIEKVHPVADIGCRVRCARPTKVVLEPAGEEIDFDFSDGVCAFTVPQTQYLSIARLVGAAE